MKDDDPHKWLARLAGDRYVEPREETEVLESWNYSCDISNNIDRIRAIKRAQDRKLTKKKVGAK